MKAVLDIKDSKAPFVMELLNSFSFVKVQPITNEKAFSIFHATNVAFLILLSNLLFA